MLDYEGGKHIAPHTYIGATTYAIHFFQRGYFAHHICWITKAGNTEPRIRIQLQQPPLYISSSEAIVHAHIRILVQQPTLYISSSEAALHTTGVGLQRRETHSPHTAGATTYAVLFFQRGCCAHPLIVNYECGKHIAPHTYTNAIAYAVLFF